MTPRGADRRPADRHLQKDFPSMLPRAPFLTIGLLALSLAIVAGAPPAVAQSAGAQATRDRVPAVLAEMIDLCLIGMRDRPALEAAAAERQWVAAAPETIQDGGTVTVLSKTENGHRLMLNLGSVDFADFSPVVMRAYRRVAAGRWPGVRIAGYARHVSRGVCQHRCGTRRD